VGACGTYDPIRQAHGGRKRSVNVREVLNGIFYVLWTRWKALPKDLPE
jgi:transposase